MFVTKPLGSLRKYWGKTEQKEQRIIRYKEQQERVPKEDYLQGT